MSMQYSKRKLRLLRLLGSVSMLLAVYFLMIAFTDPSGDKSSAPWLPSGDADAGDYVVGAVVGLMAGGGAAGIYGVARACLRRTGRRPGQEMPGWRYREMSRREKRGLAAALTLSSSAMSIPFALSDSQGGTTGPVFWIFIVAGTLGTVAGMTMILIQVRPSRTVMQIVEARLKTERAQMAREMADMRESDARQMEQWKDETLSQLYSMIMEQVDKGLITCGKCAENGAAHHAPHEEEPPVPLPRRSKDANEPCECGGPTSIPVIYFPPRFQSKRTAS